MNSSTWAVKKMGGEEIGSIRKLIIDPQTRELSYADIALAVSNEVIRLPWEDLEIKQEGIFLKATHSPFSPPRPHAGSQSVIALDVPPNMAGQIGRTRPDRS